LSVRAKVLRAGASLAHTAVRPRRERVGHARRDRVIPAAVVCDGRHLRRNVRPHRRRQDAGIPREISQLWTAGDIVYAPLIR
jgi:hypothetical protein